MGTVMVPASAGDALGMITSGIGYLADADPAGLPAETLAEYLGVLEQADAIAAAARGKILAAFSAGGGHLADGQRSPRTWLVHCLGITRGQAAEHLAVAAVARQHPRLLAGLREGYPLTRSVALQLAKWLKDIPPEFRDQAEELLAGAVQAGADLAALAAIYAELRNRTAPPDRDRDRDPDLDNGVWLDTTLDGAGVLRGNLSPQCAAMVQAVLDALSAPAGAEDRRSHPQRFHDAMGEAMRRLLASDLLPRRAGQPVKALVHIYFAELCEMDGGSVLQDRWITEYRAAWAGHRAAASVRPGDGGAWLEGEAARAVACDAMVVPVVTGDIDPGAIEVLITACVEYHRVRSQPTAHAEALARLEHQILGQVIRVVSGPGGIASFLRRNLLGRPLGGPSLPLDAGATDEIPVHLRRLAALRDQHCQFPGGCDQPVSACEPHHVVHRADGGRTSLAGLTYLCWWHHHVVLHQRGWKLLVHPDGTSQVTSPDGTKTIHSNRPPPRPG